MHISLEFPKYLEPLARTKSSHIEVFSDFVRMSACALSAWTREEEYLEVAGKYKRPELDEICKAFGSLNQQMEEEPFEDLLGQYYTETAAKATRDGRGEFYTPPEISQLMAILAFRADEIIEKWEPVSVHEPACGSGGMIMQMAKQLAPKEDGAPSYVDLMRVTAIDVSPTACDMAHINFTSWGIPSHIIHGNALSLEEWGSWKNIHWHRVWEDARRSLDNLKELISWASQEMKTKPAAPFSGVSEISENPDYLLKKKETSSGQFEFDLE